jgi:hypothetical protein
MLPGATGTRPLRQSVDTLTDEQETKIRLAFYFIQQPSAAPAKYLETDGTDPPVNHGGRVGPYEKFTDQVDVTVFSRLARRHVL